MNEAELAGRNELDRDILYFVCEMQSTALVTEESVHSFLTGPRRRKCLMKDTERRLAYLVDGGYLKRDKHYSDGVWIHNYEVTAMGINLLDRVIPPLV